jgi:pimeloyl-ACP methyl ester carboxylesterase
VIGDAGHFPMIDDPVEFAQALAAGVEEVTQPR